MMRQYGFDHTDGESAYQELLIRPHPIPPN